MKANYLMWVLAALLLGSVPRMTGAETAKGKDKEEAPVKVVPFKVASKLEQVGQIETVTRVFVTTETNQFTFLLPRHFRFQTDDADQSLSLSTADGAGLIKLRIREREDRETPKLTPETVRESLLGDHPDAQVVSEYAASAGSLMGMGMELQWRAAGAAMVSSRIALIPFPGGIIEFSQTARTQQLGLLNQAANQVFLSFRQAPVGGKLNIAPLSDKL